MTPGTDNPNDEHAPNKPEDQLEAATPPQPPEPSKAAENEHDLELEDKTFDELMEAYLPGSGDAPRGEIQELPIVDVRDDYVLVDIGGKAEASIPASDFPRKDGKPTVQIGQVIQVIQVGRNDDGSPRFSHKHARMREAQQKVREAHEAHEPVKGFVSEIVKGGVMVDIGLDAFMPASQVDLFKIPDLNGLVGREIEAYVLEFDGRRNRAVLSRRQLLYERRESERKSFLESLQVGSVITGKVKSCLDFGIFVDLDIVDGFIPREEVSWDRGKSPADLLEPGTEMELKVINIQPEQGKVTLSRKRLQENPWDKAADQFPTGSAVRGKIVAIETYGAFVQLAEGLTGMIHASDMSWSTGNKKPEDYVRLGDEVTAKVLEVSKEKKRISLGLKQLTQDPWEGMDERFPSGSKHKGTVTSLTNYGAFIKLDEYVEGMVHVSDLSWEKRVGHPKEYLKPEDEVDVVVLKLDHKNRRVSLGIKQLKDSPYDAYLKKNPVGSVVKGKVTRFAPFGAFVELEPGLEGLIHISQIDERRVELPEKALNLGDEVTVKIIGAERKNQKISLSRKEAMRQQDKESMRSYMKGQDKQPGGMTFGEALQAAREQSQEDEEPPAQS